MSADQIALLVFAVLCYTTRKSTATVVSMLASGWLARFRGHSQ